jgi:CRP-like cAMP-binding protein
MELMPNIHFNKEELIFEEGYPADCVYLVCDGAVQVFKKRENKQIHLAELGKDAIFGEMAFISERPRSATVMASEDTWCYSVNKDSFNGRLKSLDDIIKNIFEDLVDTVRKKSEAALVVDHGSIIDEPLDELERMEVNAMGNQNSLDVIAPSRPYDYLTKNEEIIKKVEEMDVFMRKLYFSLVNIACQ